MNAIHLVPVFQKSVLACGGCVDAAVLINLPWGGFGGLLLWAWILTSVVMRRRCRRDDATSSHATVRGWTLLVFGLLGSVGYIGLSFLSMGSTLLPGVVVGAIWAVYLTIRLLIDLQYRFCRQDSTRDPRILTHTIFLVVASGLVIYYQTKASTLEHYIACLRYGNQGTLYSKVMPRIVSRGEAAVPSLIAATQAAAENEDKYYRMNIITHASFCLSRIGGQEAEQALAGLLEQFSESVEYYDYRVFKAACFAYARCAGPRSTEKLIGFYEQIPDTKKEQRWVALVALLVTGTESGVSFALDRVGTLISQMENEVSSGERRIIQAALGCLLFGSEPMKLKEIPTYRHITMIGHTGTAERRPNDYNSEFYWTAATEERLPDEQEIVAEWKKNSMAIRERWLAAFE